MGVSQPAPARVARALRNARVEYGEIKWRAKFGGGSESIRRQVKRAAVKALRHQAKLAVAEALS